MELPCIAGIGGTYHFRCVSVWLLSLTDAGALKSERSRTGCLSCVAPRDAGRLEALREIDLADANDPKSLRYNLERVWKDVDMNGDGELSLDELMHVAASAVKQDDCVSYVPPHETHNLPLLLTALTSRRNLQRRLGEEFTSLYRDAKPHGRNGGGNSGARETTLSKRALLIEGDDAIDFERFKLVAQAAKWTPEDDFSEESLHHICARGHSDRTRERDCPALSRAHHAIGSQ